MLDFFRKGQRWLTLIFVSVIGLVFVFFLGVGGSFGPATPTGGTIIQLDDLKLTSRDFAREKANTENRLRQQLGDSYDQVGADRYVDAQAFNALLNSVILEAAATDLGLRVTRDEIRRLIQANPTFVDEDGRFSPAAFERFAEYEFGSQRAFIDSFTRSLLGQKLVWLLIGQTEVSESELDLLARYEFEEVNLAYVALDTTSLPPGETVQDADVEAYAEEHEDVLRARFELESADSGEPETVRARHIFARVDAGLSTAEEEALRDRLAAARERIVAGEEFAVVAREVSEDTGTAANGGDLGLFARGANDPAFDEAAFALEAGELSGIVRSDRGLHLIQVDEKIAARPVTFESRRLALAREQATREAALARAREIAGAISAAIEAGSALEDAGGAQGVEVRRTAALKRRPDGLVPGVGADADLLAAAFALEAGSSSPEIFELPDRLVLISVVERKSPSEEELIAARNARREQVEVDKQNRVLQNWITNYRLRLEAAGRLRVNAEYALGTG